MKRLIRITLLAALTFAWAVIGLGQNANQTPQSSDRAAQKQAERERKAMERQRRAEEKEAAKRQQNQVGVRCTRLHRKQ